MLGLQITCMGIIIVYTGKLYLHIFIMFEANGSEQNIYRR